MKRAQAFAYPVFFLCVLCATTIAAAAERFTPLSPVPGVRIIDSSAAHPGGRHEATNIIHG